MLKTYLEENEFTIDSDGKVLEYEAENDVVRGGIEVEKQDTQTGSTPQGNASFAGIDFEIVNSSANPVVVDGQTYKPGEVVMTITTNESGWAGTGDNVLPYGRYTVRESKTNESMLKTFTQQTVNVHENGVSVSVTAKDEVERGGLALEKQDSITGSTPQGDANFEGITFQIINNSKNDFHPEQKTSPESHKSGDAGERQVHTEKQGAIFHTEDREPESVPSKSAKNTTQDKRGQNGHPEKKKTDYEKKKSGNSQLKVKETDSSVKISGKVELNTWQRDATVNQISNQTPALASGAAQVRSFANYGQAVMAQAGGGAAVGVAGSAATGGVGFAIQAGEKLAQKLTEQIKEAVQNAVSSFQSSQKSWGAITAIFFIPLLLMLAVVGVFRMGGSATNVGLSEQVLELMPQIREACQNNGIPEYVPLVAAVVMQESGGNVELVHGDVMQCAEGMGYPVGTPVPVEESLDFGTELLADYLSQAGSFGPSDIASISLALQSYNFGGGYLTWALEHYGGYSKENAQEFSDMQAAAMGWSGYGDPEYVDHVLRYYQVTQGGMGDRSAIANGFFAYPFPGHTWTTYDGHEGIDISFSGIEGQPVYAAAAGTVSYVQNGYGNLQGSDGLASYGNCVFIDHENGWESRYAHMTVAVAQQGQYVQEGQLLGYVGNTGNSYGAHLHLALYYYGSPSSGGVIYAEQAWPQLKE